MSSSAGAAAATAAAPTSGLSSNNRANLPYLTAGLLQSACGVNFSSFSHGFGAGLTNCAPLLDAQASMVCLHAPMQVNLDLQLAEAAVRLAVGLFMGSRALDAKKDTGEALKQRWCAVVYNLMELISESSAALSEGKMPTATTAITERLMSLMRSVGFDFFKDQTKTLLKLKFLFLFCVCVCVLIASNPAGWTEALPPIEGYPPLESNLESHA